MHMYKRIIVKIGTKVLSKANGLVDEKVLAHLVDQIAALRKKKIEVLLVTSGAVGSGRSLLGHNGEETIADKQVFAAVGQVKLMNIYSKLFAKHGFHCAQILATKEDFRDKGHYENMSKCFRNLLRDGIVPIVNENDVVAIKELIFTDNDELCGLVALQLDADAAIILTSVDGVLDGPPADPKSRVIPEITARTIRKIEKYVTVEKTAGGRGGMASKFDVARKLIGEGIPVHIANGKRKNVLSDIVDGKHVGTKFCSRRYAKK